VGRDPIEEEGGLNLYGFVGNNSVNRWDYLGMFWVQEFSRNDDGSVRINLRLDDQGNENILEMSGEEYAAYSAGVNFDFEQAFASGSGFVNNTLSIRGLGIDGMDLDDLNDRASFDAWVDQERAKDRQAQNNVDNQGMLTGDALRDVVMGGLQLAQATPQGRMTSPLNPGPRLVRLDRGLWSGRAPLSPGPIGPFPYSEFRNAGDPRPPPPREGPPASSWTGNRNFQLGSDPLQPSRNPPGAVNGINYTGHAFDQMQNRGIPPSVVASVIQNGTPSPGSRPGTATYFDSTNNVTVVRSTTTGVVITIIPGGSRGP